MCERQQRQRAGRQHGDAVPVQRDAAPRRYAPPRLGRVHALPRAAAALRPAAPAARAPGAPRGHHTTRARADRP